jgi:hypothetical protein
MHENLIFTRLDDLATCLKEQIEQMDLPGVAFCGVIPGDAAIANYVGGGDECGMAWVRLVNMFASEGIIDAFQEPGNCNAETSFTVEVGILRCMTVGDESGEPPTPEEYLESAQLQIADALCMKRAIVCCEALPNKDYMLGPYLPTGPLGGIYGGTWQLTTVV